MESFNANNFLPPRKRLLAELRRENSEFDYLPPVPFVSGDLGARLRDIINSPDSTPEKILEVSESVALAATEIAVVARKTAIEKAAAATKAKSDAKDALLFLDSITMNRKCRKVCSNKIKMRKKHIPIKLLYKTYHPSGSLVTHEELTRKMHHAMNSSSIISNHREKLIQNSGQEVPCNSEDVYNETAHDCNAESITSNYSEGKTVVCSKADNFEEEEDFCHRMKKQQNELFRSVAGSRKVRVKQKKLLLSQCNLRDIVEPPKKISPSENLSFKKESNLDSAESNMSSDDTEVVPDGGVSMKITSAWKCKKIRALENVSWIANCDLGDVLGRYPCLNLGNQSKQVKESFSIIFGKLLGFHGQLSRDGRVLVRLRRLRGGEEPRRGERGVRVLAGCSRPERPQLGFSRAARGERGGVLVGGRPQLGF
ncbi:hypothetical protein ZIOFF_002132 [Zingiber officinale]|uniref:Uncharacterized protein n=1 Tax=Zingiber officinale TaxID=94328 RepID=A0A8J5I6J0_ZINOF|nr:hypothetical protein ZIOFF_002132 [Zingiber officinale]